MFAQNIHMVIKIIVNEHVCLCKIYEKYRLFDWLAVECRKNPVDACKNQMLRISSKA